MKTTLPTPANYMQDVLNDIKQNIVRDQKLAAQALTEKILGFRVKYFDEIEIEPKRFNEIKNQIDPNLLVAAEQDLITKIEERLKKPVISKKIDSMVDTIVDDMFEKVEQQMYTMMFDMINEKVAKRVEEEMNTWLVAEKFI